MLVWIILAILVILLVWYNTESFTSLPDGYKIYDSGKPGPCIGILAGMHGNEPAASIRLDQLINDGWFGKITCGSVRIIPRANPTGLRLNTRYRILTDMNRLFVDTPSDSDALAILKFFEPCDLVIDFHEGWGFHGINHESLGSTLLPNSDRASLMSNQIVQDLNNSDLMRNILTDNNKKAWMYLDTNRSCEIPTTLSCYLQRRDKHHILVETTGQNDIQPKTLRGDQVQIIIDSLLSQHGMI
jgi:predicted deacylase